MVLKEFVLSTLVCGASIFSQEKGNLYDVQLNLYNDVNELYKDIHMIKNDIEDSFLSGIIDYAEDGNKYTLFLNTNAPEEVVIDVYKSLKLYGKTKIIPDIIFPNEGDLRNNHITIKIHSGLDEVIKTYCKYYSAKEYKKLKRTLQQKYGRVLPNQYIPLEKKLVRDEFLPQTNE